MTYRGAGGIRLFRFDGLVETSKPPLIDSSILVSLLFGLDGIAVVVAVVVSLMGLDRLRRNQADEEDDDVALMEASN